MAELWLYVRLQESLYIWFGNLGGILAVLSTIALVILLRHQPERRDPTAAGLQVVSLATFLTIIYRSTCDCRSTAPALFHRTGPPCGTAENSVTPSGSCCSRLRSRYWSRWLHGRPTCTTAPSNLLVRPWPGPVRRATGAPAIDLVADRPNLLDQLANTVTLGMPTFTSLAGRTTSVSSPNSITEWVANQYLRVGHPPAHLPHLLTAASELLLTPVDHLRTTTCFPNRGSTEPRSAPDSDSRR
jgi:type II secretory pathway pseudopilin PulG